MNLYNFKFVAYTDIYRVWSGRYLWFPKSELDLTVDLNNCVIDASSRCGLSLAARVTVEPATEKSQKNIVLNLILHACMIQE